MNASKSATFATESEVRIVWDSAPIQQAFGRRCIVADCVATLPDGRSYRGNVYGNSIGRRIEMTLRHTAGAKRGLALAESHMPLVRSAIQAAALELFRAFRVAQRFGETRPTLESLARRIEAARETGNGPAARPAQAEPEAAPAVDPAAAALARVRDGSESLSLGDVLGAAVLANREAEAAQAETARRDNVEYHKGRAAFAAGEALSANPYLLRQGEPDSRFARWLAGWRDAEREAAPAQAAARDNRAAFREGLAAIAGAEQAPAVAAQREVIRLEMNWSGAAGIIAAALENGTGAGKRAAREELARMAELADERNRLSAQRELIREALDSSASPHGRLAAIRRALES